MKSRNSTFPEYRRFFKSQKEIMDVINRKKTYVNERMNGHGEWTENEIRLLNAEIERRTTA